VFFEGYNLVQNRRIMTPLLPQSSSFFILESYTKDYHNNTRLLLHDSDDPKFQIDYQKTYELKERY
jgi:hypothetical protein